jgi:hypothetical protein
MSLGTGAGQVSGDCGPPFRHSGLQPVAIDPNRTLRAPRRNCGILRQTRWDGSMKRRTLKWHLLLVLSVLVSSPGSTTAQNGLASPPLRRCSPAPTR